MYYVIVILRTAQTAAMKMHLLLQLQVEGIPSLLVTLLGPEGIVTHYLPRNLSLGGLKHGRNSRL